MPHNLETEIRHSDGFDGAGADYAPITFERFARLVTMARRQGSSIRSLAKCFGMSKSTMGRWVQMIETLQMLEASHLGQHGENSSALSTAAQLPSVPNAAAPDEEMAECCQPG